MRHWFVLGTLLLSTPVVAQPTQSGTQDHGPFDTAAGASSVPGANGFATVGTGGPTDAIPASALNQPNGPVALDALGNGSAIKTLATGSTTARTEADRAAEIFNIMNYGAKANAAASFAGLTQGSPAITVAYPANLTVGVPYFGGGVPAGTTVSAIGATTSVSVSATLTANSPTVTVASAAGLIPGQAFAGPNIPATTAILAISGTTVTLSANATATTTVTATASGTAVTLSAPATATAVNSETSGTDDSAAINATIAAAKALAPAYSSTQPFRIQGPSSRASLVIFPRLHGHGFRLPSVLPVQG